MKYLRRAIKYFIQITLIFVVIIAVLMLTGMVSKDVAVAFQKGWTSVGYILAAFLVMSAAYPYFGYGKRRIRAEGDPAGYRKSIIEALEGRSYTFAGEKDGALLFHLKSPVNRLARFYEDTITITPVLGGFEAEGLIRDLSRVVMAIDSKINRYDS
ncbi:MAG: hypothetical protein IJ651_05125 [Bacteroidales bacterium]|nr:hypothetical protein [Bacteroidales bacterium]